MTARVLALVLGMLLASCATVAPMLGQTCERDTDCACHVTSINEAGVATIDGPGVSYTVKAQPTWTADETAPYQAGTTVACGGLRCVYDSRWYGAACGR